MFTWNSAVTVSLNWCSWSWWRHWNWKQKSVIYNQKWQKGWRIASTYSTTFPSVSLTHITSSRPKLVCLPSPYVPYLSRRHIYNSGQESHLKVRRNGGLAATPVLDISKLHLIFSYVPKSPEGSHGALQGSTFCCEDKERAWSANHPVLLAIDLFLICS